MDDEREGCMVRILADKNIPLIEEACRGIGQVDLYEGRNVSNELLKKYDVLLCRSTVPVNQSLLSGTNIGFVATATSGSEHVDRELLNSRGIAFANAAGSNARSVAEYVFTALFSLAVNRGLSLLDKSIGIIGVGHVGTWVEHIADKLGLKIILNDPPKARQTGDGSFKSFGEALDADIVTLHVPLQRDGRDATEHLFNETTFPRMNSSVIFLNTSRGAVVDTDALIDRCEDEMLSNVILDVYEDEPNFNIGVLQYAHVATSHIAGHSYDGKLLGTQMVYEALCGFLHLKPAWNYLDHLPEIPPLFFQTKAKQKRLEEIVYSFLRSLYDIRFDDRLLRQMALIPPNARGGYFDHLRSHYRQRREYISHRIVDAGIPDDVKFVLKAFGFQFV